MMTTVAHELVHVKQYVLGDLDAESFAPSAGEVLWKGRRTEHQSHGLLGLSLGD